jgi:Family of unknown function (DUF5947)
MNRHELSLREHPLGVLSRFLKQPARQSTAEVCEMCAQELAPDHSHIVNLDSRTLLCACRACYLLFIRQGAARGKYKAVPERYLKLQSVALAPEQWDQLQVPVGMAFFFFNSVLKRITAFYPGPAGATESLLPLTAWQELADANSVLGSLEPDVEALLVYRPRDGNFECFLVPIAACYELTGIVRRQWRGFDGGEEARRDIDIFFDTLRVKSRPADAGEPT